MMRRSRQQPLRRAVEHASSHGFRVLNSVRNPQPPHSFPSLWLSPETNPRDAEGEDRTGLDTRRKTIWFHRQENRAGFPTRTVRKAVLRTRISPRTPAKQGAANCRDSLSAASHRPELPNPFSARAESSRVSTSSTVPVSTGTGIICAIFSPAFSSTVASPRLVISTRISPR